ncbi:MAG: transporter substrate-binding domain-containing protein [Sulfurospirillaceae bacterium]|nr:transporter substrate-binding domain-containing protein [Sulfurospirillaceae bacterium]
MKKIFVLFFVLVSLLFSFDGKTRSVRSASELDYPPYCLVKPDGTPDGFSVELLKNVLHVMGIEVDFYVDKWSVVKKDLEIGKIDVLPLVGRTPERESYFDFSVPYLVMHGAVFVRDNNKNILSFEELKNKSIAVMKGDNAHEFLLREGMKQNIIETVDFETAFKMLSKGDCDAIVIQKLVGEQLVQKLKLKNIHALKKPVDGFRQDFSFAVSEGNKELLAILNEGLAIVLANGTYDRLYQKWLSPLDVENGNYLKTIRYLLVALGFAFIVIFVSYMWQRSLKNEVSRKTKELKQSEENLKHLNASLEEKIQNAINQIKEKDELTIAQSRQTGIGEMISMIAHQWRQPLSVISMFANNLKLDIELEGEAKSSVVLDAIEGISREVKHLSRTIENFSDFFRPNYEKQIFFIGEIVDETIGIIGIALENNEIQLIKNIQKDICVNVYKNEFIQVLLDIISNARDAFLDTHIEDRKIWVDAFEDSVFVTINIADNAGGMSEEVLKKIGEPYFSTKAVSGMGLGLYMSKMIIEKHLNGVLSWKNENGGAMFTIKLPKCNKKDIDVPK